MKTKMFITFISLVSILTLNFGSVSGQAEVPTTKPPIAATDYRATLLNFAKEAKQEKKRLKLKRVVAYLTTRVHKTAYVYSGSTVEGWDCSGLVRYAYKRLGIELEHSANKQAHSGTRVSSPRIGDVVVFAYKGSTDFYHSAIYVGSGLIINANLLYKTTVIQPLSDFKNSQIRFVRVIK
jgi:cell wall-associated NlpC family hydrolase